MLSRDDCLNSALGSSAKGQTVHKFRMHGASKSIIAEITPPIEALPLKLELATQRKHATSVPLPALRTTINRWACRAWVCGG